MQRKIILSALTCLSIGLYGCGDKGSGGTGFTPTTSAGTAGTSGGTAGTGGGGTSGGTSTSGGGTSAGGTSGGSSGGGFVVPPDGGAGTKECDVWTQDCNDGEKCMPWANDGGSSWNATKCSPLDPNPKQPGDTCTVEGGGVSGMDDCAKASMCWNADPDTNMGTCVAFCTGSEMDPMCDPGFDCLIANDGVLILCLPQCDPLLQDCNMGEVCIPNTSNDGFACVLDASGDMAPAGTPCEFANVCNAGLICANADAVPGCMGAVGCCAPFCDLTNGQANADCNNAFDTPGAECVPYFNMGEAPPGSEDVGVCILPQ